MLIEIKSRYTDVVLFAHDVAVNTIAITLAAALASGVDLQGADLYGADLQGVALRGVALKGADLRGVALRGADLRGVDLRGVALRGADLKGANLRGVALRGADLRGVDLRGVDLRGVDLRGVDLRGVDLRGVSLKDCKNSNLVIAQTQISPVEGAFVGWKKLKNNVIARLVIPHDAKRFNSYGSRKCRASKVVVHAMFNADGSVFDGVAYDKHTGKTAYETGKEVLPNSFDEDMSKECAAGIHYFITRVEAENY